MMKYIIQKPVGNVTITIELEADELNQFDDGLKAKLDDEIRSSLGPVAGIGGARAVPVTMGEFVSPFYDVIKKNSVRMAAIAYYLKQSESRETVTREDLLEGMQRVGWPIPKNFARDIKAGMSGRSPIFTEPVKSQYMLTSFGEKKVKDCLQANGDN